MLRPLAVLAVSSLLAAGCAGSDSDTTDTVDATDTVAAPDTQSVTTDEPVVSPPPADSEAPVSDPVDTEAPSTEPAPTEPPATDPPATEPPATDPELAAFEPIGDGPYQVGVTTITVTDIERERPLTVDVTFPLAEGATGEPQRYTFITGDYYESPDAIAATPDQIAPDGPFPLVVYTHGSGGLRYIASDYTEALASHGYIVVAADHSGNTAVDQFVDSSDDRATIAYNRPRDVQVLIDEMLNPESPETVGFVASVDPERIAVTGHSLGGYATYAVVSGMSNEAGTIEPDERIDAIIPIAPALGDGDPATSLITDERLAAVDLPTLILVGTDDSTTPVDPNVVRAFEQASSETIYRVELVAAEHQSFTDVCNYQSSFRELENPTPEVLEVIDEFAVEGCSEGDMPIDRVQELTNTFAVSFLDSVFADGQMITPSDTEIPDDVIYTVK